MVETKKNKDILAFDVMKLFMAIVIISLHSGVGASLHQPWNVFIRNFQDLAVPCFFILSSILFYNKVFREKDREKQRIILWKYERRLLTLYLIWQVVLFPVTMLTHNYIDKGLGGIAYYIKDMVFAYTFPASWFLGALAVAMPIVYIIKNNTILLISLITSLYLYFTYIHLIPHNLQVLYEWYHYHFASPRLSFPEALIWLSLGCIFSRFYFQNKVAPFAPSKYRAIGVCLGGGYFSNIFNYN